MSLRNNAWATRQNYLRGLRDLMLYLQKRPEDCSADEIKSFLVYSRDKRGLSSSSVNLRVCGIKYYCRAVISRLDLVVKILNPRIQKYHTEVLTLEEVHRLFGACRDIRQLLVLHLIYDAGLRVRELVRLRVSDFDKHQQTITIRNSKGQKTRTLRYGLQLRNTLCTYCKVLGCVPKDTLIESIKDIDQQQVLFVYKDYADHAKKKIMALSGLTFLKRFCLHILPPSFSEGATVWIPGQRL